ncbi:DUF554 domain-containing protein [Enemella sp. A6]|uniref:DUF554 domain-containing protein n=1 Tax=Enemella sp. A6 TaxID=3440152 RepID=UPI003EB9EEBC
MFPGFGTVVNVTTIVLGSLVGLLLSRRLPDRTRTTVTDALGLVTLLMGALAAIRVVSPELGERVGDSAPVLIVLGSLLLGGIVGSVLDLERRVDDLGGWLRGRFSRGKDDQSAKQRFAEGFVTASMLFCIGPLTVLGSLSDGIGLGADQLILKAVLDGFASIAFAASLGIGVMAAALSVAVVQGGLTLLGWLLGDLMPVAHVDALTATGGLMLVGLGIRLLGIKPVPVANLMPALLMAPLLAEVAARVHTG